MLMEAYKQLKTAFLLLLFFSILTGLLYPACITAIAQLFFPWQANGSFITSDDKRIGSELIGQSFTDPKYFWGRPSATMPYPYNAENSSGSNLGPSNPDFLAKTKDRVTHLRLSNGNNDLVPVDLVTASGSGLDPEISPAAAFYQITRIAKVRGISANEIKMLIQNNIKGRTFGVLGEPRINVLSLNLALDQLATERKQSYGPSSS